MTCPTCGSNHTEFCGSMVQQRCSDCGTWWSVNTGEVLFVPERSKPVESLELPDGAGMWSDTNTLGGAVIVGRIGPSERRQWSVSTLYLNANAYDLLSALAAADVRPGQYVRCVPPIVQPPDADVDDEDWRDRVNHYVCESAKYSAATDSNLAKAVDALRFAVDLIAARLDRETKGAERE